MNYAKEHAKTLVTYLEYLNDSNRNMSDKWRYILTSEEICVLRIDRYS